MKKKMQYYMKQDKNMATASFPVPTRAASSAPTLAQSPQDRLKAAHAEFMQTPKGTPEHDKAWEELVDALFTNAK